MHFFGKLLILFVFIYTCEIVDTYTHSHMGGGTTQDRNNRKIRDKMKKIAK